MDKINAAAARNEKYMERTGKDRLEFFKPIVGENLLRILPMGESEDLEYPFKEFRVHGFYVSTGQADGTGKPGQIYRGFVCLRDPENHEDTDCPLCNLVSALWEESKLLTDAGDKKGADLLIKKAKSLRAMDRVIANIIDGKEPDPSKKFKLYEFSRTLYKDFLVFLQSEDYGIISDVKSGTDFTLTRVGTGLDTSYTLIPKRNNIVEVPINWTEKVINFHELKKPNPIPIQFLAETLIELDPSDILFSDIPYKNETKEDETEAKETKEIKKTSKEETKEEVEVVQETLPIETVEKSKNETKEDAVETQETKKELEETATNTNETDELEARIKAKMNKIGSKK